MVVTSFKWVNIHKKLTVMPRTQYVPIKLIHIFGPPKCLWKSAPLLALPPSWTVFSWIRDFKLTTSVCFIIWQPRVSHSHCRLVVVIFPGSRGSGLGASANPAPRIARLPSCLISTPLAPCWASCTHSLLHKDQEKSSVARLTFYRYCIINIHIWSSSLVPDTELLILGIPEWQEYLLLLITSPLQP